MTPIVPLFKAKVKTFRRDVLETFGIYTYSHPYPGHNELLSLLPNKNGFFVQCGGNDGFTQDPTYFLEKARGWKGIIIEPLQVAESCRKNRPSSKVYNAAAVSFNYTKDTIDLIDVNLMTVVKGETNNEKEWVRDGEDIQNIKSKIITVPARTIQSVIDEYSAQNPLPQIDLLVLDIEGYEFQAIQGFDFTKNRPRYVLIESHTEERLNEIKHFLSEKKYTLISNLVLKDYLFADA